MQQRQAGLDRRLTRADRIPDLSFAVTYHSNLGLALLDSWTARADFAKAMGEEP